MITNATTVFVQNIKDVFNIQLTFQNQHPDGTSKKLIS
jgi:hypothetical protein